MINQWFIFAAEVLCLVGGFLYVYSMIKRAKIEGSVQIQCSSGDSEVMSFTVNTYHGESEAEKTKRFNEVFGMIQGRRDDNHKKWLEVKEAAIQENLDKASEAQD